jgi:transposase
MDDISQLNPKREKLTAKEIIDIRKSIGQMESVGFTDEDIGSYIPKDWIPQLWEKPVDKRKQPRNPERQEQVKELLIKGKSQNKIAKELGVSIGTVQYWVKKIGPVETKSGRKKAKGEVDSKENYKKWAEQMEKAGDYWLREEELLLKRREQARKQQQDEEERKE